MRKLYFLPEGMDRTLTYYISGPMAGYPDNNFPMFQNCLDMLVDSGLSALSPHKIVHNHGGSWGEYLVADIIEMLTKCQGLILIPGWPQSKGARMELETALRLDWPVYYFDPEIPLLMNMNKRAA